VALSPGGGGGVAFAVSFNPGGAATVVFEITVAPPGKPVAAAPCVMVTVEVTVWGGVEMVEICG
jgi:hypothetical protein